MQEKHPRPISPHLPIYKMQISSALSIMHRATGLLLFIGLVLLIWWITYCALRYGNTDAGDFSLTPFVSDVREDVIFGFFATKYGRMLLVLWSYCLFYHTLSGIRHLVWDAGFGFEIKHMVVSGWVVIALSLTVWLGTWTYLLYGIGL